VVDRRRVSWFTATYPHSFCFLGVVSRQLGAQSARPTGAQKKHFHIKYIARWNCLSGRRAQRWRRGDAPHLVTPTQTRGTTEACEVSGAGAVGRRAIVSVPTHPSAPKSLKSGRSLVLTDVAYLEVERDNGGKRTKTPSESRELSGSSSPFSYGER